MIDENIQYRLPLKLVNSYTWAGLIKPARAALPVIGVHINLKINQAKPGIKLIAELAGYRDPRYRKIRDGIDDLIKHNLIIRQKEGRHYVYSLTDLSFCKRGRSYLPIYKKAMIISRKWAGLTSCEKTIYSVMGVKARINDPEAEYFGFYAIGNIYEINKYIEWAGISQRSFYNACEGLNHKNLIEFWVDEDPDRYGVYVPQ